MALKKQVTDNKGVITRYHKIHSFDTDRTTITIKLRSFATEAKRNEEQSIEDGNVAYYDRQQELQALQNQITALMEQNQDGSKTEQIQQLTAELNEKTMDPNAPQLRSATELHAVEREVKLGYFEPISLAALYQELSSPGGDLEGATEV